MNQVQINQDQQHTIKHIISGAVASGIVSGAANYKKVKRNEIEKKEAIKDTVKITTQGAIATGAAITTANYLNQKDGLFKALTAASVGIMGVYAIEILNEKICENKKLTIKDENDAK